MFHEISSTVFISVNTGHINIKWQLVNSVQTNISTGVKNKTAYHLNV